MISLLTAVGTRVGLKAEPTVTNVVWPFRANRYQLSRHSFA